MLDGPGAVRWAEAPDLQLSGPDAALVRPMAVATCDLDVAVLKGRFPLEGPYPFGHEGVGEVVDVGPNSIGLYAVGLAIALGASRVVYADQNAERLAIAARLGAETREGSLPRKIGAFPITVDASGDHDGVRCALNSTAFDGICT